MGKRPKKEGALSSLSKRELEKLNQQDHDRFVRGILNVPGLVKKLLLYALDDEIKPYLNLSTLRPMPDTHIDKRLRISHSDGVHECELNQTVLPESVRGELKLPTFRFVFIWEHKSVRQSLPIDFQIGGYDDSIRRRDFKKDAAELSIVLPILIYHGKEKWDKKRVYDYFKPYLPPELLAYIPYPKIIVIDIQAMSDLDIENAIGLEELRAAFIALKHGHDKEFFKQNSQEIFKFVREIPTKELFDTYVEMLFEYMQRRSQVNNDEFQAIIEQSIDKEMITHLKPVFKTAREEGREEGILKGVVAFIKTTELSDRAIAAALDTSVEYVEKIRKQLAEENLDSDKIPNKYKI